MKRHITAAVVPVALVLSISGFRSQAGSGSSEDVRPQVGDVRSYAVDAVHSTLGFKVRHLGIANVNGRFSEFSASLSVDPTDPTTLEASATVQVASVDTGVERRDDHLRSDDFFDAENHPTMTFVSRGVRSVNGSDFELVGDLTIRGIKREVVFDATFVGEAALGDSRRVAFEGTATVNRFDYGLRWNRLTELGGLVVSERVRIVLEIEAIQS